MYQFEAMRLLASVQAYVQTIYLTNDSQQREQKYLYLYIEKKKTKYLVSKIINKFTE